jgi:hypothetical protein
MPFNGNREVVFVDLNCFDEIVSALDSATEHQVLAPSKP